MQPTVIIGLGQLGSVFAHGFLRTGRTVVPVTRQTSMGTVALSTPEPELALVAVAEDDLDAVLAELPDSWRDRVGLLQNELLPHRWEHHGIVDPTVIAVWFEKKRTTGITEIVPSPIAGPHRQVVSEALDAIGVGARWTDDILGDLILKNLYILVANIAGLEVGGTTGTLWTEHRDLVDAVAQDVLALQSVVAGRTIDRDTVIEELGETFLAVTDHATKGRSAPARLQRAVADANRLGIDTPTLRRIDAKHSP